MSLVTKVLLFFLGLGAFGCADRFDYDYNKWMSEYHHKNALWDRNKNKFPDTLDKHVNMYDSNHDGKTDASSVHQIERVFYPFYQYRHKPDTVYIDLSGDGFADVRIYNFQDSPLPDVYYSWDYEAYDARAVYEEKKNKRMVSLKW